MDIYSLEELKTTIGKHGSSQLDLFRSLGGGRKYGSDSTLTTQCGQPYVITNAQIHIQRQPSLARI